MTVYLLCFVIILMSCALLTLFMKKRSVNAENAGMLSLLQKHGELVVVEIDLLQLSITLENAGDGTLLGLDSKANTASLDQWLAAEDHARLRNQILQKNLSVSHSAAVFSDLHGRNNRVMRLVVFPKKHLAGYRGFLFLPESSTQNVAENQFFSFVMDSIPFPIFCKKVDDDFRYTMCNSAWKKLFSTPSLNLTDREIFTAEHARRIRDNDLELLQMPVGDKLECYEQYTSSDGGVHYGLSIKRIIQLQDDTRLLLGITIDQTEEITLRKQVEDQLQLMNAIFEHINTGLSVKSVNSNYSYIQWNRELEKQTGYSAQHVIGKRDEEIQPWPRMGEYLRALDQRTLSEHFVTIELAVKTALGKDKIYILKKQLLRNDKGERFIIDIYIDITEQKQQANELLRERESLAECLKHGSVINECLEVVASEPQYDLAINEVLQRIGAFSGADRCYIYRYKTANATIADCTFEWKAPGIWSEIDTQQNLDFSLFPDVQQRMEKFDDMIVESLETLPASGQAHLAAQGIQSLVLVPLHREDGGLLGMIGIDFVRMNHKFNESEIQTLHEAAKVIELAWARNNMALQLRSAMERLRQVFDKIDIPLLLFTTEGRITMVNSSALERHKNIASETEVIGKPCNLFCGYDQRPEWCPLDRTLETGDSTQIAYTKTDGHVYRITTQPIFGIDGKMEYVLESAIDITKINQLNRYDNFIVCSSVPFALSNQTKSELNVLLERIASKLNATQCYVMYVDEQKPLCSASSVMEYVAPGQRTLFGGVQAYPFEENENLLKILIMSQIL